MEYTQTANDREKYATYTRDSVTGLDYAMNRYYSSVWGRFLSPDPSGGSVRLRNPQTWNRYAYVNGDPVDGNDPFGLDDGPGGICGATSVFNASLTGPPAACNTLAATAWSAGLDTWSTYAGGTGGVSGLSQNTTITQVDIGAADELIYAQGVTAFFWAQLVGLPPALDPSTFNWNQIALGVCEDFLLDPSALRQCQDDVFALSGGVIGCSGPSEFPCTLGELTIIPPNSPQPPQPVVLGPLGPPFAPNPTAPTCQKGFHPSPMGGGSYFNCAPNPSVPVPAAPPSQTPIQLPGRGGIPREGTGSEQ